MKKLITILAVLFLSSNLYSTPADSCLKMFCENSHNPGDPQDQHPNTGSYNPDSVRVDSCIGSPTYMKLFAKKYYFPNFKINNFLFDYQLMPDSIKRVADISPLKPDLKAKFQQLESQFGTIYFQGEPYKQPDTAFWMNPGCRMYFENYQNTEEIVNAFTSSIVELSNFSYGNRAKVFVGIEELYRNNIEVDLLFPNPVQSILDLKQISVLKSGQITIYTINGDKVRDTEYKEQVNVSDLQAGIYFLIYNSKTYKFIISR